MNKAVPFSFNFLYYAGIASILPFFILYYQERGFSGAQISLLAGLPPLVTLFFSPFWTNLADRTGRHKQILGVGSLAVVLGCLIFPALRGFLTVLGLVLLFYVFISPITSLADSATLHMLSGEKEMYGRIRLGGTIGWGVAAPIIGALIARYGLKMGFWACAGLFVLVFGISRLYVFGRSEAVEQHGSLRGLLAQRHWVYFMIYAFFGGVLLSSVSNYLAPYIQELGGTAFHVGVVNLAAAVSELPAFFFGNRLLRRFGARTLMLLSLVVTAARSVLFALSPTAFFVILAQLLNGLTFATLWTAGVAYADEHSPEGLKATGQGMLGAMTFGFGAAVGGFAGGFLLESLGGKGLFLVTASIVMLGVGIVVLMERQSAGGQNPS